MPTIHVLADDDAPAEPTGADPAWLALSAALTDQLPTLADREDLTVSCAPGQGRGAPGCFVPALAAIELDGDRLEVPPATCDPARPSDRERYPATWGVLVHEAAHARHTAWHPDEETAGTAAAAAAMLLEESRIEAAQLARRPGDRHWLRAAATRIVLADALTHTGEPGKPLAAWAAAHAAGLLLARADAGILDHDEVAPVAEAVRDELGDTVLDALQKIWADAHTTADDDADAMLALGRRWCDSLDLDPDQPQPGAATPDGDPEEPGEPSDGTPAPSAMAAAINTALDAVRNGDSPTPPVSAERTAKRAAETAARRRTERAAEQVFHPTGPARWSRLAGTRPPTPIEQAAARRVARALRAAAHRERTATTHTSPVPPGRLRMRDALAADAQRAAGATVTAEPFVTTVRRHAPEPPLRLAVACDVSGSMGTVAGPVASAAWILARAAGHLPDARTATVIFGDDVQPVTHPGRTPALVQEFNAIDCYERANRAIDALDAALDLTRPGAARLLVIVSDGHFRPDQLRDTQDRITRLTRAGCAVLWLTPEARPAPARGVQTVRLTDPAATADLIATAATRALATA